MDNNIETVPEELNEEEMVDFIFGQLQAEKSQITREEVVKVLSLEFEYMIEKGYAVPME